MEVARWECRSAACATDGARNERDEERRGIRARDQRLFQQRKATKEAFEKSLIPLCGRLIPSAHLAISRLTDVFLHHHSLAAAVASFSIDEGVKRSYWRRGKTRDNQFFGTRG